MGVVSGIRTYRPKGSSTKAIRFTVEEAEEARSWCSGRLRQDGSGIFLAVPTMDGVVLLKEGDYLCHTKEDGFRIETREDFEKHFELVRTRSES